MAFDEDGTMRKLCVNQGYVPSKCTLDGFLIMALVEKAKDPCGGCFEDRGVCDGRPRFDAQPEPNLPPPRARLSKRKRRAIQAATIGWWSSSDG